MPAAAFLHFLALGPDNDANDLSSDLERSGVLQR